MGLGKLFSIHLSQEKYEKHGRQINGFHFGASNNQLEEYTDIAASDFQLKLSNRKFHYI